MKVLLKGNGYKKSSYKVDELSAQIRLDTKDDFPYPMSAVIRTPLPDVCNVFVMTSCSHFLSIKLSLFNDNSLSLLMLWMNAVLMAEEIHFWTSCTHKWISFLPMYNLF
jgi:hypothetical protein